MGKQGHFPLCLGSLFFSAFVECRRTMKTTINPPTTFCEEREKLRKRSSCPWRKGKNCIRFQTLDFLVAEWQNTKRKRRDLTHSQVRAMVTVVGTNTLLTAKGKVPVNYRRAIAHIADQPSENFLLHVKFSLERMSWLWNTSANHHLTALHKHLPRFSPLKITGAPKIT